MEPLGLHRFDGCICSYQSLSLLLYAVAKDPNLTSLPHCRSFRKLRRFKSGNHPYRAGGSLGYPPPPPKNGRLDLAVICSALHFGDPQDGMGDLALLMPPRFWGLAT